MGYSQAFESFKLNKQLLKIKTELIEEPSYHLLQNLIYDLNYLNRESVDDFINVPIQFKHVATLGTNFSYTFNYFTLKDLQNYVEDWIFSFFFKIDVVDYMKMDFFFIASFEPYYSTCDVKFHFFFNADNHTLEKIQLYENFYSVDDFYTNLFLRLSSNRRPVYWRANIKTKKSATLEFLRHSKITREMGLCHWNNFNDQLSFADIQNNYDVRIKAVYNPLLDHNYLSSVDNPDVDQVQFAEEFLKLPSRLLTQYKLYNVAGFSDAIERAINSFLLLTINKYPTLNHSTINYVYANFVTRDGSFISEILFQINAHSEVREYFLKTITQHFSALDSVFFSIPLELGKYNTKLSLINSSVSFFERELDFEFDKTTNLISYKFCIDGGTFYDRAVIGIGLKELLNSWSGFIFNFILHSEGGSWYMYHYLDVLRNQILFEFIYRRFLSDNSIDEKDEKTAALHRLELWQLFLRERDSLSSVYFM